MTTKEKNPKFIFCWILLLILFLVQVLALVSNHSLTGKLTICDTVLFLIANIKNVPYSKEKKANIVS